MKRIISSFFFLYSFNYAINPAVNGKIPQDVIDNLNRQNIGYEYGDPGWLNKIDNWKNSENRDSQLEFNIPVLLGLYSDASSTNFTASDYQNSLFDNNPSGSMKEYYNEISYGNFIVDGTVSGWYQSSLSRNQAIENTRQYVAEIANLADPNLDFSQFDNDGPDNIPNSGDDDGYVDGLVVVFPGCMDGGNNIWPHQSSLYNQEYVTNDVSTNGGYVIVSTYMVCPELPGSGNCINSEICPIGVYAHEFGHVLGLPDLYDRDESNGNSEGIGEWCLMASGSWTGWWGDTPVHMSSWCKIQMGWIIPSIVQNNTNIEIAQLATSSSALKIWEDDYYWSRYFLIENRQAVGFDSQIHGPGLIVYHINENRGWGNNGWSYGSVNDDEDNKLVDLEAADGFTHLDNEFNRGDNGDPFPGASNNRIFDNNSVPSSQRNDGSETNISLFNISDSDSLMTIDIDYRTQYGYAISYDENGIGPSTFGIGSEDQWSGVLFNADYSGYITEIDFGIIYHSLWDDETLEWVVYVYDSFNGTTPGVLMDSVSGISYKSDWISVAIDSVPIAAGQEFFVSVKIINETYGFCYDNTGELSGRSYLSGDGVNYDNMLSAYGDANIRAKLSTDDLSISHLDYHTPTEFKLYHNYPNPFNPNTTISIELNIADNVSLEVFNIEGRLIENINDSWLSSGKHQFQWNGKKFSSGIYILQIQTSNQIETQKLMLLK